MRSFEHLAHVAECSEPLALGGIEFHGQARRATFVTFRNEREKGLELPLRLVEHLNVVAPEVPSLLRIPIQVESFEKGARDGRYQ